MLGLGSFLYIICSDSYAHAVRGLALNGTETSIDIILRLFSKTRDGQVRGEIVKTLRSIHLRNQLSEPVHAKLLNFIGNSYPFFHGKWYDLKKSVISDKEHWNENARTQLSDNTLNLIFTENDKFDILLHIEKMKKDFIRYINVIAIPRTEKTHYSKHYTPNEDFESVSYLFDRLFEQTKEMRPDNRVEEIINLIESEMLPNLLENIKRIEELGNKDFSSFEQEESRILNDIFGTDMEFAIAHILTNKIHVFDDNPDKEKYVELVKDKWNNINRSNYSIIEYLDMKKAGNICYE
ncbi:MAG: hypothetical protein RIG77_07490 [Cyclobacteriaceae bacterium]